MWVQTRCRLEWDYTVDTPIILMLRPRSGAGQWIADEHIKMSDIVDVIQFTDAYGNLCQKLTIPKDGFVIETSTRVKTAEAMDEGPGAPFVGVMDLPEDVLPYILPSRYCESDRLGSKAWEIVEDAAPGYDQVSKINEWIQSNIKYMPGTSGEPCSADEILGLGEGVCKDHAHVGIGLARSISIPARFVVGYLLGLEPMDLHAWYEIYAGGRWYTFDSTQQNMSGARVAVAYGRDAADVSIYHQFGPPARFTDMQVDIEVTQAP